MAQTSPSSHVAEGSIPDGSVSIQVVGLGGPLCSVTVPEQANIAEVKSHIEAATGVPVDEQGLFIGTRQLQDASLIAAAGQPEQRRIDLSMVRMDPLRAAWLHGLLRGELRLRNAPPELQADKEVVLAAVSRSYDDLMHASDELRRDREVVLAALAEGTKTSTGVDVLRSAPQELRADREVVLAAVSRSGSQLRFVSDELLADREVVLAAVSGHGDMLELAAEDLRADREVVMAAVARNPLSFRFASEALRGDREVTLAAVSGSKSAANNGMHRLLEHASEEMRADRAVVLAAIRRNPAEFQFASPSLRADREVVLAAGQWAGWQSPDRLIRLISSCGLSSSGSASTSVLHRGGE